MKEGKGREGRKGEKQVRKKKNYNIIQTKEDCSKQNKQKLNTYREYKVC